MAQDDPMFLMLPTKCDSVRRPKIDYSDPNKEIAQRVELEPYNVLPLPSNAFNLHVRMKYLSLEHNEYLKCAWDKKVDTNILKDREPVQFFSLRDLHFYNNTLKILPSESPHKRKDFRLPQPQNEKIDCVEIASMFRPEEKGLRLPRNVKKKAGKENKFKIKSIITDETRLRDKYEKLKKEHYTYSPILG